MIYDSLIFELPHKVVLFKTHVVGIRLNSNVSIPEFINTWGNRLNSIKVDFDFSGSVVSLEEYFELVSDVDSLVLYIY